MEQASDFSRLSLSKDLSSFEKLPEKVLNEILNYCSESVPDLALTSKAVKDIVYRYATHVETIQLVNELTINESEEPLRPLIEISHSNATLFELRLRHFLLQNGLNREQIKKEDYDAEERVPNTMAYSITINSDDATLIPHLRSCIGGAKGSSEGRGRIGMQHCRTFALEMGDLEIPSIIPAAGKLTLFTSEAMKNRSHVCHIIDGLSIDTLKISFESMSDDEGTFLKQLIVDHNVEHLELTVRKVALIKTPLLDELSFLVRSLRIWQQLDPDILSFEPYFFGIFKCDWALIVLEMLGKDRKLDKLSLYTQPYEKFFSEEMQDTIVKRLPYLCDEKKIFFETSREYTHLFCEETKENGYQIKGVASTLRIVHSSRVVDPELVEFFKN